MTELDGNFGDSNLIDSKSGSMSHVGICDDEGEYDPAIEKGFRMKGAIRAYDVDVSDYLLNPVEFGEKYKLPPDITISPDTLNIGQDSMGYDRADDSGLNLFLTEMKRFPLLNRELERIIFTHRQAGHTIEDLKSDHEFIVELGKLDPKKSEDLLATSRDIKDVIILTNMRLAVMVANRFKGMMPIADMIHEGLDGLNPAIEKFDVSRGFKFSTYAMPWISQRIRYAIQKTGKSIRLPNHFYDNLTRLKGITDQFSNKHGRNPKYHELVYLAMKNGLRESYIESIITASIDGTVSGMLSLDMLLGEDGDATLADYYADNLQGESSISGEVERNITIPQIWERIKEATRDKRTQDVIVARFGLDGSKKKTLDELGKDYNVTRERIRQIETKGLAALRRDRILRELVRGESSSVDN